MASKGRVRPLRHVAAIAGMLLVSFAVLSLSTAQARPAAQAPSERNIDLVLLIDESGSAWGTTDKEIDSTPLTTDRKRLPPFRIQTAQYIISRLAVEPSNAKHRVAVYAFGSTVEEVAPMQQLDQSSAEAINNAIYDKHYQLANLKFTDTEAAFRQAYAELSKLPSDPNRRSVVVMITDGKPETEQANVLKGENTPEGRRIPDYLNNNTAAVRALDGVPNIAAGCGEPSSDAQSPVYVFLVDQEARNAYSGTRYVPSEYPSYWKSILGNNSREVQDFEKLWGEASTLVAQLLCVSGGQALGPFPLPHTEEFEVRDDFARITFSVKGSTSDTVVSVIPPGATTLDGREEGVAVQTTSTSRIWSIDRNTYKGSWTGTWKVEVAGTGQVEFSFASVGRNYRLAIVAPKEQIYPAGKPLDIQVQVVDNKGQAFTGPITSLTSDVTRKQNGAPETVETTPLQTDGAPTGIHIDRAKVGEYTIAMSASLESDQQANLTPDGTISVLSLPWLRVLTPRAGAQLYANDNFSVDVSVVKMGVNDDLPQPIDEIQRKRMKIKATLHTVAPDGGQELATSDFETAAQNVSGVTHSATLPGPSAEGTYQLDVQLDYTSGATPRTETVTQTLTFLTGGAPVDPTVTPLPTGAPAAPAPSAAPIASPTPSAPETGGIGGWIIPGAVAAVGVGGLATWLLRLRGGPQLNGAWLDTGDAQVFLKGRQQKVSLLDSSGIPQATVLLSSVQGINGPQGLARILRVNPGQELRINGAEYSAGQEIALDHDATLEIGGRTTRYQHPESI